MKPRKYKAAKIFFIITFLICGLFFVKEKFNVNTSLDEYDSKYIYVENRTSKSEVIKKNHKVKTCPASLTKIMTTIVALEHIEDLSAIAPVDVDAYKEMVNNNSSMAGFYGKEQTTYRDLLYGTILSSGGEAANSLAINIAGSVENFVKLMNNKASELGLHDTHFVNPEGLHDKNQYTTAYDMAKLLDYALDNGHFRAILLPLTLFDAAIITRLSQQPWKLKWRFPAQIWHNGFGKQPKPYREVTANVSIPQEGRSVDRKECLPVTNGAIDSIRFTGSCERTI
jgi:D-alanyl-D-alanine carboxypeptidase (penicillin-binding protein 5/6)